ncbi:GbsR/MarR family transcriptional regulator [Negadavirga shengliensis]|uniref:GbsR/MarR family transcriptional regulator n=1 Tax=Negadavirga shengliensis TaxID=1389218 RepID=A0ABV9T376_9BACT
MQQMTLNEKQKEIIEKIGVLLDSQGMQPALGRIMGMLMVVPDAEATFEEIQENLSLSKSAVSYGINILLSLNKIVYKTKPGQRKRYFRINISNWEEDMRCKFDAALGFEELINEIIAVRGNEVPEFNDVLRELQDFMCFLKREIPVLIKKYKKIKGLKEGPL